MCLDDLALVSTIVPAATRRYSARFWRVGDDRATSAKVEREGTRVCSELPKLVGEGGDVRGRDRAYFVLDVFAVSGSQPVAPLRIHGYHLRDGGHRIVALERPDGDEPPVW